MIQTTEFVFEFLWIKIWITNEKNHGPHKQIHHFTLSLRGFLLCHRGPFAAFVFYCHARATEVGFSRSEKNVRKKNVVHLGKMGDEIFHKVGKIFLLFGFYDIFAIRGNFWKSTQFSFGISLFWITHIYDLHHLPRRIPLSRNPAPVNR